jgi:shikimate kinase
LRERALTLWLRADVDVLLSRLVRRNNRPLLKNGDPRAVLERLMAERYPVYVEADIVVDSIDGPIEAMVDRVMAALERYLAPVVG